VLLGELTWESLSAVGEMVVAGVQGAVAGVSGAFEWLSYRVTHKGGPLELPYLLLPAPLPAPYQKPLTLVLDLDLIFHAPPSRVQRAGMNYFLTQVSEFAEIVLVSDQPAKGGQELMQTLDPLGQIAFRLTYDHFRAHDPNMARRQRKAPVRDLQRLNRDMSRVIVLSADPQRYARHQENVLKVQRREWHKHQDDRELFDLVPVLLHLSQEAAKGHDLRQELEHYQGLNVAALGRAHYDTYRQALQEEEQQAVQGAPPSM